MATYSTSPSDLRENGSAAAERIKEKVGRTAESVKDSVREGADRVQARVQEEASHAVDSFRDRVSERPLTSLAIGVCIGMLAGFLFHRR